VFYPPVGSASKERRLAPCLHSSERHGTLYFYIIPVIIITQMKSCMYVSVHVRCDCGVRPDRWVITRQNVCCPVTSRINFVHLRRRRTLPLNFTLTSPSSLDTRSDTVQY